MTEAKEWLESLRGETIDSAVIAVLSRRYEAREALIGKLVEALKACRSSCGGYCITKDSQYESTMKEFWKHIRKCDVTIDAALAKAKERTT